MTLWRAAGLIALTLVLLLAVLVGFASTWLRLGLTLYGADNVTFESLDLSLDKAELIDLRIGDPISQTVDYVSLDYTLAGMIGGQVDRVTVSGLNALITLDDLEGDDEAEAPLMLPVGTMFDELVLENSRLDLETPAGLVSIPLAAHFETIDQQVTFELAAKQTTFGGAENGLSADLVVHGSLSLNDAPLLDRLAATGELSIQADGATIPDMVEGLEGEGEITFKLENGKLDAVTDQWSMKAAGLPLAADPLDTSWQTGLGKPDEALRLTGRKDNGDWRIALAGPLMLQSAAGKLMADLDLHATLNEAGRLSSFDHGLVSLAVSDVSWQGAEIRSGKADMEIIGLKDAFQGRLTLDAEGIGWQGPSHAISDVTLQQELDVAFDGQTLDLAIADKGRMSIDKIAAGDQLESGWFTVRLYPNDAPLVSYDIGDGSWTSRLAAEIDPVRLETGSGQWWARIENLDVRAAGNSEGLASGHVLIKQGRADLPSANLALIGIESDIQLAEDRQLAKNGLSSEPSIPVVVRAIRPLNEPRWFSPLRLDATLQPLSAALPFSGRITTRKKPGAQIDFSGRHDLQSDQGTLNFKLPSVSIGEGGLRLSDIAPELRHVLSDVSGRIALNGELSWGQDDLTSTADILIEELGLAIGPARLERVNTLLHFDNLMPPTLSEGQELAIGLLDVGLPLTDGLVSLALDEDGDFAVDQLTWRLAGGQVSARPFTFGSDVQTLTMILDVEQLDLNELLGLTELDGLAGEGLIDGVLPLTISETGVTIADGKLDAAGAGVLRYRPEDQPGLLQAGGESVGLMLRALENFRYDKLNITLDGRTDGDTKIGLHVSGANPDLYEGHPIEFNLDLEGDLANLVQTNISNYQIPDRIREKLQGFGE